MFINTYGDNSEFYNATENYPALFTLGFVRNQFGLQTWNFDWVISDELNSLDSDGLYIQILRALPVIGILMGISRLYSVWSTYTFEDNCTDKIIHTLIGIIEICGLGFVTLIIKILYIILAFILVKFADLLLLIRKDKGSAEDFREFLIDKLNCGL
ncbi:hypothetical protein O1W69_05110 [Chlamydia sp. 12-01]|uniref:hypothetical protein n=1 Tax=Chlamydia sp. 12-01 TaxID=3002742 RepID=UPI0035D4B9E8